MADFKDPRLSRRELLATFGALAAAACFPSLTSCSFRGGNDEKRTGGTEEKTEGGIVQQMRGSAAQAQIESQALRGGVHVLIGSGGNIGVLTGSDATLLVDSGLAGSQPQITKALGAISGKPLKYVVNTHWHFDHCDGNAWTRAAGATVMAHPNTKKHLSRATRVPDWDHTFEPTPESALPNKMVTDQMELKLNGGTAAIRPYGFNCHTDGDLFVHFADADVLHCGDTFWNGHYPFIDTANGGSIGGMLRATEENLKLVGEKTLIIPGHGSVARRSELTEFRDMLAGVQEAVARLKKEGKTVEEAITAKPTAPWDARYADFIITPEHFTRIAYAGV